MAKARVLVDIQGKPPRGYKKFVAGCGEKILQELDLEYKSELSVLLTDDVIMQELNLTHRNLDKTTDVLSFSMMEGAIVPAIPANRYRLLGDVVISVNQAIRQAGEQSHSIKRELALLIAHGILHLLGYDDDTEEGLREMEARGRELTDKVKPDEL